MKSFYPDKTETSTLGADGSGASKIVVKVPTPRALPFRAGPYECYHYIGGNLAEVYIARDLRTGFNRAVKVLGAGYGVDSEFMRRFVAEGQTARQCSHPNIVTTYEAEQSEGLAYIAMEHLQGETLKVLLERGKLRTMTERINIAWQVAHGMAYLHSRNIIHRDIKPENVNVDPYGRAKIFDFGVARQKNQQITKEGQVLGTPLYMSPEQVRGEVVTPAADLYSFGVVMFVMFSGSFPYRAVSRDDLYAAIIFYPPDLTPLDGKGIPEAIRQLIVECLQKAPASRPASFRAIEERLRPMASPEVAGAGTAGFDAIGETEEGNSQPARSKSKPRVSFRRLLWAVVAATILVAASAVMWYYTNRPKPLEPRIAAKGGFMVLVPAGPGFVGRDRRAIQLAGFYIDRAEVSNEVYRDFSRSTGRELADASQELPASLPVVNVTYDDSAAFCEWAGKRLPTDLEWEKAARGAEGRPYPWGSEPRLDLVNVPHDNEPHELQPAESNLNGASPYGAINLVGNVWEWVDKREPLEEGDLREVVLDPPVTQSEPAYQIRGGSFQQSIELRQAVWDFAVAPARLKRADVGFRCARGT